LIKHKVLNQKSKLQTFVVGSSVAPNKDPLRKMFSPLFQILVILDTISDWPR